MSNDVVKKIVEELAVEHISNFDPVRFVLLQSLCKRLSTRKYASNICLIERVVVLADRYQADIIEQRSEAQIVIKAIALEFAEYLQSAQELFNRYEYRKLERLLIELRQRRQNASCLAVLKTISAELANPSEASLGRESGAIQRLIERDKQGLRSVTSRGQQTNNNEFRELRSMAVFRESIKHVSIDRAIERAIENEPENPGPHNPHMLAIQALVKMRTLSPAYLRRFARHVETLLLLEKSANKMAKDRK